MKPNCRWCKHLYKGEVEDAKGKQQIHPCCTTEAKEIWCDFEPWRPTPQEYEQTTIEPLLDKAPVWVHHSDYISSQTGKFWELRTYEAAIDEAIPTTIIIVAVCLEPPPDNWRPYLRSAA